MNNERRKELLIIFDALASLSIKLKNQARLEENALNNIPEQLQMSERADRMQETVDQLEEACSLIEEALDCITAARE